MLYHWSCIVDFSAKLWNHSESTSLVPRYFPSSIIQLFTVCENDGGSPVIVYHINDMNFNQCRQGGPKSFFSIPVQVLELWTVAKQKTYRSLTNYTHKVHLIFHSGSRMLDYGQMLCGAYHWHTLAATVTNLIHFKLAPGRFDCTTVFSTVTRVFTKLREAAWFCLLISVYCIQC